MARAMATPPCLCVVVDPLGQSSVTRAQDYLGHSSPWLKWTETGQEVLKSATNDERRLDTVCCLPKNSFLLLAVLSLLLLITPFPIPPSPPGSSAKGGKPALDLSQQKGSMWPTEPSIYFPHCSTGFVCHYQGVGDCVHQQCIPTAHGLHGVWPRGQTLMSHVASGCSQVGQP